MTDPTLPLPPSTYTITPGEWMTHLARLVKRYRVSELKIVDALLLATSCFVWEGDQMEPREGIRDPRLPFRVGDIWGDKAHLFSDIASYLGDIWDAETWRVAVSIMEYWPPHVRPDRERDHTLTVWRYQDVAYASLNMTQRTQLLVDYLDALEVGGYPDGSPATPSQLKARARQMAGDVAGGHTDDEGRPPGRHQVHAVLSSWQAQGLVKALDELGIPLTDDDRAQIEALTDRSPVVRMDLWLPVAERNDG